MTNFIDKFHKLSRQCVSAAVILDSKGVTRGRIVIRFTNGQIGFNHQLTVLFLAAGLNYSTSSKGGSYDQPGTLFKHLNNTGRVMYDNNSVKLYSDTGKVKMYNYDKKQIVGYGSKIKDSRMYDSLSRFDEICYLKVGRKTYRIAWAV